MTPSEEQRAALVAHLQHALALVRGPFLDGFWLGEDAPFDEWVQQQQQQWQGPPPPASPRASSLAAAAGEVGRGPAPVPRLLGAATAAGGDPRRPASRPLGR